VVEASLIRFSSRTDHEVTFHDAGLLIFALILNHSTTSPPLYSKFLIMPIGIRKGTSRHHWHFSDSFQQIEHLSLPRGDHSRGGRKIVIERWCSIRVSFLLPTWQYHQSSLVHLVRVRAIIRDGGPAAFGALAAMNVWTALAVALAVIGDTRQTLWSLVSGPHG